MPSSTRRRPHALDTFADIVLCRGPSFFGLFQLVHQRVAQRLHGKVALETALEVKERSAKSHQSRAALISYNNAEGD